MELQNSFEITTMRGMDNYLDLPKSFGRLNTQILIFSMKELTIN